MFGGLLLAQVGAVARGGLGWQFGGLSRCMLNDGRSGGAEILDLTGDILDLLISIVGKGSTQQALGNVPAKMPSWGLSTKARLKIILEPGNAAVLPGGDLESYQVTEFLAARA